MFGYSGGENADTIARKQQYRKEAQAQWPFLTTIDLSMLRNETQLVSLIKDRSGLSQDEAHKAVTHWMQGKQF
jgi:hypothetical protein